MKRAVFLDKDGTLVPNLPYNVDPTRVVLAAGVAEGLRRLSRAGYGFIVVSNQSGIARGFFSEQALAPIEERLRALFEKAGVELSGFYYCPHHPEGCVPAYAVACACRKPQPGLILRAAAEHGISLPASWLIGDILDDVEAGARAGCRTVLFDNGGESEWRQTAWRRPTYTVTEFAEAACSIVSATGVAA